MNYLLLNSPPPAYPIFSFGCDKNSIALNKLQIQVIQMEKTIGDLNTRISVLQDKVHTTSQDQKNQKNELSRTSESLGGAIKKTDIVIGEYAKKITGLNSNLSQIQGKLDGCQIDINQTAKELESQKIKFTQTNASLDGSIKKINQSIEQQAGKTEETFHAIASNSCIAGGLLLITVVLIYFILKKRIFSTSLSLKVLSTTMDKLHEAQDSLKKESINLDLQILEIISRQLDMQKEQSRTRVPVSDSEQEQDHSQSLKFANEVIKMEMNLSRMDPSIKGYKQLFKGIERIKNNFAAHGYELVEMIGNPYHEGMRANVDFVTDEKLKTGERIITAIVKPQINHHGNMIQKADIIVSQNI